MKFIDLTGQRFGRLIIIQRVENDKRGNSRWLCLCDCGKEKIIRSSHLRSGAIKSCGCLLKEKTRQRFTKHGHNRIGKITSTYGSWQSMKQRCTNPNYIDYHNWGGRGIKICKRWMKFSNFLEDMGECPPGLTLDRKNNNKNYCKSNCGWATRLQQMRNMRSNHLITYNGKTQTLIEWSEEVNIKAPTIRKRLKLGWSVERTLTVSVQKRRG